MKKVIAMVICVAMLACFAVTASAEAVKATFNVTTVEGAKKGDVVTVDINIAEKGTKIGTFEIQIDYDKTYLKFVENEDEGAYFVTGDASGGATAAGNEETMAVQMATANGFFKIGTVLKLSFEVIEEIPADQIAAVSFKTTADPTHCEDATVTYDVVINAGGVKGPKAEGPKDPQPPVDGGEDGGKKPVVDPQPQEPTVTVTDTDEANPETGDVSGIAVAAGLCAVMAAAFVITKKVND